MMRRSIITLVVASLGVLPAFAQHGRGMGSAGAAGGMGHGRINQPSTKTAGGSHAGAKAPTDMLTHNTKLAGKLESLLPAGTKATDACSGFKNLGQCVAAVHVSHNLGITFSDLKAKMLGTPANGATAAVPGMSLGKAIQALDPHANAKAETSKAASQANTDLKEAR